MTYQHYTTGDRAAQVRCKRKKDITCNCRSCQPPEIDADLWGLLYTQLWDMVQQWAAGRGRGHTAAVLRRLSEEMQQDRVSTFLLRVWNRCIDIEPRCNDSSIWVRTSGKYTRRDHEANQVRKYVFLRFINLCKNKWLEYTTALKRTTEWEVHMQGIKEENARDMTVVEIKAMVDGYINSLAGRDKEIAIVSLTYTMTSSPWELVSLSKSAFYVQRKKHRTALIAYAGN